MSVKSYPLSVLLHLIAVILYGYSISWQLLHPLPPSTNPYGGRLKYLTYWNLWIQFITFTVALICDFISNPNNNRHKPRPPVMVSVRDTPFNGLALPLAAFVSTSFW